MKMKTPGIFGRYAFTGLLAGSLFLGAGPRSATTQIDLWHAFTGHPG